VSLLVPFMAAEEIRRAAESVLEQHQPGGGIPIEIEQIIEFGFEMEIRPVKGLNARFGLEGAISHGLDTVVVDEDFMTRTQNRYRFTLAHELGHRVLHGDIIRNIQFGDRQGWKSAVLSIDAQAYARLEHQAYVFAGHMLVPTSALMDACEEARRLAVGVDLSEMGTTAISYVAGNIAKEFRVSTAVMERRIAAERMFEAGS